MPCGLITQHDTTCAVYGDSGVNICKAGVEQRLEGKKLIGAATNRKRTTKFYRLCSVSNTTYCKIAG
jgi:hypothetical protein